MNNFQQAVLGGGCFWCLEAAYQQIAGVSEVEPGYAGGHWPDPTYERVCSGTTGHAEVVRVTFDPAVIDFEAVLEIFWTIHDPTTPNRQGHDVGSEYRSMILYADENQRRQAEASKAQTQKLWPDPVVTEIVPLEKFWPAEAYHRNYFQTHPEQAYCQVVINPKLEKLRQRFAERLKPAL